MNKLLQIAVLCGAGAMLLLQQGYAAPQSENTTQQMSALSKQQAALVQQVQRLQQKIAALTRQQNLAAYRVSTNLPVLPTKIVETPTESVAVPLTDDMLDIPNLGGPPSWQVRTKIHQVALNYIHGVTVTTSPILGLKSAWNASDLLYSVPSMNEDLSLLRNISNFEKILQSMGSSLATRPLLVFSGALEATGLYSDTFANVSSYDINLTTMELDVWAIANSWASAFASIDYDSSPPQTGARVTNSRIYLQRGFLTFGNLLKSPFYLTIGQMYVPFGRYSSAAVTAPLTMSLARIEARAAVIGYYNKGLYAEIFGFKGSRVRLNNRIVFQGGANIGYQNPHTQIGGVDIGTGFVSNIADSQGMQANGLSPGVAVPSTQFAGFGLTLNQNGVVTERLQHDVPGVDFHLEYTKGVVAVILEWVGAVSHFAPGDLRFNGSGAMPTALHAELDLNYMFGRYPVTFGTAYGRSSQALPLNLPQQSIFAYVSTSFWKDTIQALEYRHDINYPVLANTGGGGNGNVNNIIPVPSANVGGSQNLVTLEFGIFF